MPTPAQQAQEDKKRALKLQLEEYGIPSSSVMPLVGMQMMAQQLEKIKEMQVDNDARLAQQLHVKLNPHFGGVVASDRGGNIASGRGGNVASGRGGNVASGRGGIGRADAMTDSEFKSWLESGGGSSASSTYAERLEILKNMPL
jgi:hypothetical protein